jgi:allophanate hydrolase
VNTPATPRPLDIQSLQRAYREGTSTPSEIAASIADRISSDSTPGIWIQVREKVALVADAAAIERASSPDARPPLYGIPFAVKDNIDVHGLPTTAACREFAYAPAQSAAVVERLIAAGALCVGKTNLDQFATGLVGVRSPYGIPPNPFDAGRISGGSSSGSAAAVARGLVSFALATDTAGSGRVPAAFNRIVGLKPSPGLFSTRGVVPACRSLDCVSLMALTAGDAAWIAGIATGFDPGDPYSHEKASSFDWRPTPFARGWTVGIPRTEDLAACDPPTRASFGRACADLEALGASLSTVDMTPFFEAGRLLYDGPWIAERLAGLEPFVRAHPDALLPVIRAILEQGEKPTATDVFRGLHRLQALKRAAASIWSGVTAVMVPSAPTLPRIDEVLADPIALNARLGQFTTFGNLLGLAAIAVPTGDRADGLPSGATFIGPWGSDAKLLGLGCAMEERVRGPLGATGWPYPGRSTSAVPDAPRGTLQVAVVGAHLSGMPLNRQLTERGATFVRTARTAPSYRLYALPDTRPPKPGLVRVSEEEGVKLEVEVWALPEPTVGSFLALVGAPLAIGTVALDDDTHVHGFLCEAHAVARAEDISSFGGWRAYVARG